MVLIGYHGGREVVKTFSAKRRRRSEYGAGFYFADDIELAGQFGPIISEYRLNLKNPLIADQFYVKHVLERESGQSGPTATREQGVWISRIARKLGYDGIVIRLVTGQRYFVAFRAPLNGRRRFSLSKGAVMKCTHVFAVPGAENVIAEVHPVTGRSSYSNKTLEEIRQEHPTAEVISWEDWITRRSAEQDQPVTWTLITEERYHEMLNVLPPLNWALGCFQVSEPVDHHVASGAPRYTGFRKIGDVYSESSRPMTSAEFKAVLRG